MKKFTLTLMLAFPLIASAQLQNMDFEQWESNPVVEPFHNKPTGWSITDGFMENTCYYPPATDTPNGNYALTLGVWYHYVKDNARQTAPINSRPSALKGYYKYTDTEISGSAGLVNDAAQVSIWLTKWNEALSKNDTIGYGQSDLNESLDFSSFTCPVTYTSDATPDTVIIYLDCSKIKRYDDEVFVCLNGNGSFFTVDGLSLEESTMGNKDFIAAKNIKLYPNPAIDDVIVSNFSGEAKVYDITGKIVIARQTLENNAINVQQLQKGIYVMKLTEGSDVGYLKLIKD